MCALADFEFALSGQNEIPTPTLGGTAVILRSACFFINVILKVKNAACQCGGLLRTFQYPALSDLPYEPIALRASRSSMCSSWKIGLWKSIAYTRQQNVQGIRLTHAVDTLCEHRLRNAVLQSIVQLTTSRSLWESDTVGPESRVCSACYIDNLTPDATKRNDKDRSVSAKGECDGDPLCRTASVSRVSCIRSSGSKYKLVLAETDVRSISLMIRFTESYATFASVRYNNS